jgi:hypothetical protein
MNPAVATSLLTDFSFYNMLQQVIPDSFDSYFSLDNESGIIFSFKNHFLFIDLIFSFLLYNYYLPELPNPLFTIINIIGFGNRILL